MATLVLSTAGSMLGGPVGSALGALIGQSIDQELFASQGRGPRVGDLNVQTSTYGAMVPRVYGAMRVAGSVIWSTDLVEGAETTGAKGQPSTIFSYMVSLAVAVSSRPIQAIRRIWADGKIIRDFDGVFKVPVTFRVHGGGEDQELDPLIASVEGIESTPGYRGLALAVFENLELAEFGNRIPFFTFEVIADEDPEIQLILADATNGLIACSAAQKLHGYAAYGATMSKAVEGLIQSFALTLVDNGRKLVSPSVHAPLAVKLHELGASPEPGQETIQRDQQPAAMLPAALSMSFYDPLREFQTGDARATVPSTRPIAEERHDLPAAMQPAVAGSLAHQLLARRWRNRDRVRLRLPMRYLATVPGDEIELPIMPPVWQAERVMIEGFTAVLDLKPREQPLLLPEPAAASTLRRASLAVEDGELQLALIDIPDPWGERTRSVELFLAASSASPTWKRAAVEISCAEQRFWTRTAPRKTVLGTALSALPPGASCLIDSGPCVTVELVDGDQWLRSCTDEQLVAGVNLALLGDEILQFGEAVPLGGGRFELRRLLRGRVATEWATDHHRAGDLFVVLDKDALTRVRVPIWGKGSQVKAQARKPDGTERPAATIGVTGESLRPPSPAHLRAERTDDDGMRIEWTPRSPDGAWIDEIDLPTANGGQNYHVTLRGARGVLERDTAAAATLFKAENLDAVGQGPTTIEVRQIGDSGVSRPATLTVMLT